MDLSSNQNKLEERLGGASLMRLEVKEFFENIDAGRYDISGENIEKRMEKRLLLGRKEDEEDVYKTKK